MKKEWINRSFNCALRYPEDVYLYGAGLISYAVLYLLVRNYLSDLIVRKYSRAKMNQVTRRKFHRALWKFLAYSVLAIYGACALCTEKWMVSPFEITLGWPGNKTPAKINVYYLLEASYYTGSFLTMFIEDRQSDFYLMVWHHFVTLVLLVFSYRLNFLRHGVFLMIIHDVSDPWMDAAKIAVYLGNQVLGNCLFAVFTVMFIVPRILIYPMMIIFPGYRFMKEYGDRSFVPIWVLLVAVFVLNGYWAILIVRMLMDFLRKGNVEKDIRDKEAEPAKPKPPRKQRGRKNL